MLSKHLAEFSAAFQSEPTQLITLGGMLDLSTADEGQGDVKEAHRVGDARLAVAERRHVADRHAAQLQRRRSQDGEVAVAHVFARGKVERRERAEFLADRVHLGSPRLQRLHIAR